MRFMPDTEAQPIRRFYPDKFTGHPAEVLHCFFFERHFKGVDNRNIISVIKDANFYHKLQYLFYMYVVIQL